VITAIAVRESRDEGAPRSLDVVGVISSTVGLVALATLLIESGSWGVASPAGGVLVAIVLASGAAFVFAERRARVPLLDLALFRNGRFLGASVTSFVLAFVAWAALFFLPLDFESARGYSTLMSGLLLLPCTITWALVSLAAGRIVARAGTRLPMAAGVALTAVGLILLALHAPPIAVVLVALAIVGTGIGLAFAPMTKAALDAVPAAHAGMASGAILMTRMVGATFGPAACGAAFRAAQESASGSAASTFATALTAAMALAAGLAALGACLVFVLGRKPLRDPVAAPSTP
jgi:MFS family permease